MGDIDSQICSCVLRGLKRTIVRFGVNDRVVDVLLVQHYSRIVTPSHGIRIPYTNRHVPVPQVSTEVKLQKYGESIDFLLPSDFLDRLPTLRRIQILSVKPTMWTFLCQRWWILSLNQLVDIPEWKFYLPVDCVQDFWTWR